eukprot:366053-Chlamydomonas_euryale.AAC.7
MASCSLVDRGIDAMMSYRPRCCWYMLTRTGTLVSPAMPGSPPTPRSAGWRCRFCVLPAAVPSGPAVADARGGDVASPLATADTADADAGAGAPPGAGVANPAVSVHIPKSTATPDAPCDDNAASIACGGGSDHCERIV